MTRAVRLAEHYDAELARHHRRLLAAMDIRPTDRVLDVGCGAGRPTRDAARAASSGSALGVDIAEEMLAHARARSAEEGVRNVSFELGDAQVHPFPAAHFDVVISRFGTMFFRDLAAAFTHIAAAARPGARLAMMVWQAAERNEWATAIPDALLGGRPRPAPSPGALDPFSLADPARVRSILGGAGLTDVGFDDVEEPLYYGADVATAFELVTDMRMVAALLAGLDAAATERALARLRELLASRQTGEGVWLGSRAWIVTARFAQ